MTTEFFAAFFQRGLYSTCLLPGDIVMVATPVTPYIQFPEPRRTAPTLYTRIPDAVLLDTRVTPVQLRIYAVIARRADRETASAFPSYATIARDANISRRSAING